MSYVVNQKICDGVEWKLDLVKAGDVAKIYPTNLVKDSQSSKWKASDGGAKDLTDADKKTTKAPIAMCRYWYDEQKYGKPFCCQMYEYGSLDADKKYTLVGTGAGAVIDGTKTGKGEALDYEMTGLGKIRSIPGAETFQGAIQMTMTAATAVAAAAVAMY